MRGGAERASRSADLHRVRDIQGIINHTTARFGAMPRGVQRRPGGSANNLASSHAHLIGRLVIDVFHCRRRIGTTYPITNTSRGPCPRDVGNAGQPVTPRRCR